MKLIKNTNIIELTINAGIPNKTAPVSMFCRQDGNSFSHMTKKRKKEF